MRKYIKILSYMFLVFSSWTFAYSFGNWFTIPNTILIMLALLTTLYTFNLFYKKKIAIKNISNLSFRKEDIFLLLAIIIICLSFLVNGGNANYILAYFFTFVIMYLLLKEIFIHFTKLDKILKVNLIAVSIVIVFVILEFLFRYKYGVNIKVLLNFGNFREASFLGGKFPRAFGFSNEPTNLGYYLNALGPLAFVEIYRNNKIKIFFKIIYAIMYLFAFIVTFSTASFLSIVLSLILVVIIFLVRRKKNTTKQLFISIILISFACLLIVFTNKLLMDKGINIYVYIEPHLSKFSLNSQYNEPYSRIFKWRRDFKLIKNNPLLGYGPGMTSIIHGSSSINWYLDLIVEDGILTLFCILMYIYITFTRILKSKVDIKYIFLVSYMSSLIHLFSFSSFHDPALWILLIIFDMYERKDIIIIENKKKL